MVLFWIGLYAMRGYRMGKAASARGMLIQRIPKMAPNDMIIKDIRVNAKGLSISFVGSIPVMQLWCMHTFIFR